MTTFKNSDKPFKVESLESLPEQYNQYLQSLQNKNKIAIIDGTVYCNDNQKKYIDEATHRFYIIQENTSHKSLNMLKDQCLLKHRSPELAFMASLIIIDGEIKKCTL